MKKIIAIALIALSAQVAVAQQVTEFNGYSVRIVTGLIRDGQTGRAIIKDEVPAEAQRICRSVDRNYEFASQRVLPGDRHIEVLYLCL